MNHDLLFYDVAPGYLERRAAFRDARLKHAWDAHARGELMLAGALGEPVDGAVLAFRGDTPAVAEAFARSDPYVQNGLVAKWAVRPWVTVVGDAPSNPLRRGQG